RAAAIRRAAAVGSGAGPKPGADPGADGKRSGAPRGAAPEAASANADAKKAAVAQAADAAGIEEFARRIVPDPVLLFRYSAVTFNGHRIHYDRSYVTGVEGYPGLVVHGPLIATLLLDLLRRERPTARVSRFSFKALRPLFDLHPFEVCGRAGGEHSFDLWGRNHGGLPAMQASAELHQD